MYSSIYPFIWWCWDRKSASIYARRLKQLRAQERLSTVDLQRLQWDKLTSLLRYASEKVPYYQRLFSSARVDPAAIRTPEDLQRIPILTRQDVQQNFEDMVSIDYDKRVLHRNATGGSTGSPMPFYVDREFRAEEAAVKARADLWRRFSAGDKVAVLWGADRDIPALDWFSWVRIHYLRRQRWLNSYNMTTEKMANFARILIRWQPSHIHAYAGSLYLFAKFLQDRRIDQIRPVSVSTSAEKLWDYQRALIEDVFGCKVFNFYGARENPSIAAECQEHSGLHVFSDNVYLELMKNGRPAGPGEVGEVFVTSLTKRSMPLIRYRNGDLARATNERCPCGRPFPLIAEIVGRSNDMLVTPSGQLVHGAFFNHLFFGVPDVQQFQIHQQSRTEIKVLIASSRLLSGEMLDSIRAKIENHMGEGIQIRITQVDRIVPGPSGKHRYIISDVGPSFARI
jgi:phenylacetate-CoA ligase